MFDIGWSEMAIIMLLALIIIGPKDLPRVARTIGQWVRKGRMLAREFQTSLEDMAKETELDDVRKEIEKVGRTDLKKTVENTIDPKGDLSKAFDVSTTSEPKPALSSDKRDAAKKALPASSANGHADGTTPADGTTMAGDTATAGAADIDAKAPPTGKTKPKSPARPKTTRKTAKAPTTARSKKPTAARKPASSTKKPAKPRASAKPAASAKPGASAKRGADPASSDDGGGSDRTAMAAKPS